MDIVTLRNSPQNPTVVAPVSYAPPHFVIRNKVAIPKEIQGVFIVLNGAAVANKVAHRNDDHNRAKDSSRDVDKEELSAIVLEVDAHGSVLAHREAGEADLADRFLIAVLAVGHAALAIHKFFVIVVRFSALDALPVVQRAALAPFFAPPTLLGLRVQVETGVAL